MKIIRELSALTKKDQKTASGIRMANFLAVALVTSVFFLGYDMIHSYETYYIKEYGDYHLSLKDLKKKTFQRF